MAYETSGEFICKYIHDLVIGDCGHSSRDDKWYQLDEAMSVCNGVFQFSPPNGRLTFRLEWDPDEQESSAWMSIEDQYSREVMSYIGYKELSWSVPLKLCIFIAQKIWEVCGYGRELGPLPPIAGGQFDWLSDEEMDGMDERLYGKHSTVLRYRKKKKTCQIEELAVLVNWLTKEEIATLIANLPEYHRNKLVKGAAEIRDVKIRKRNKK